MPTVTMANVVRWRTKAEQLTAHITRDPRRGRRSHLIREWRSAAQAAQQRRGAAHCRQRGEAAGAIAKP